MACLQVGGEGGEEQGILPQGPKTFKEPHEAFIFMILGGVSKLFFPKNVIVTLGGRGASHMTFCLPTK